MCCFVNTDTHWAQIRRRQNSWWDCAPPCSILTCCFPTLPPDNLLLSGLLAVLPGLCYVSESARLHHVMVESSPPNSVARTCIVASLHVSREEAGESGVNSPMSNKECSPGVSFEIRYFVRPSSKGTNTRFGCQLCIWISLSFVMSQRVDILYLIYQELADKWRK